MKKPVKISPITSEIKKEYLKEHLEEVEGLIKDWMLELTTPSPFAWQENTWGWPSTYRSSLEQDTDSNHILRRHLRSRALWHNHAVWERNLEDLWKLINRVDKGADKEHQKRSVKKVRSYTENYVPSAILRGFEVALGREIYIQYKIPDKEMGVSYARHKIENSAKSEDDRALVEKKHREFSQYIAGTETMEKLVTLWKEIQEIQQSMNSIAGRSFKSKDILYPCRFCKHLWK